MNRLENKVCIITGASDGMGRAAMNLFLQEGASVMATARSEENLRREVEKTGSDHVIYYPMDIADEEAWKVCIAKTIERFGRIDVLVNNAGTTIRHPLQEWTVADWRKVLDINLIGHFIGIREVIPHMKAVGGGSIVNVGSVTAIHGGDLNAAGYCAAKGGLLALTRHAAAILGPDRIRVNCVHPGFICTGMARKYNPDMTVEMLGMGFRDMVPLPPHAGSEEDMAYAYLYLASDESKFVTGQDFSVDGGYACCSALY